MDNQLDECDANMLEYYLFDKGNIEDWWENEKKKPIFQNKYPELLHAMHQFQIAELTLKRIARSIIEEINGG